MKKLLLTVITVLCSIPSFAQYVKVGESCEYNVPFQEPTLERSIPEGATLVRTITFDDGSTCDESMIEKDFDESYYYTFKKKNGDFFTINGYLVHYDTEVAPFKEKVDEKVLKELVAMPYSDMEDYQEIRSNKYRLAPDVYYTFTGHRPFSPFGKLSNGNRASVEKSNGQITLDKGTKIITVKDKTTIFFKTGLVLLINDPYVIYLPGQYEKGIKFSEVYGPYDSSQYKSNLFGYPINDRLYNVFEGGELKPIAQKFGERYYFANQSDTIVDVQEYEKGEYKVIEIKYKNGDNFCNVSGADSKFNVGTIHRNGGILTIKKDVSPKLTMPDGTTYVIKTATTDASYYPYRPGSYGYDEGSEVDICRFSANVYCNEHCDNILQADEIKIREANVTYPDGSTDKIYGYKGKKQREEEQEAEKAQKAAEAKKIRDSYIKKYGYYPGDYKRAQDVIKVGRSFGAIEEFFICKLMKQNGNAKQYKVFILNSLTDDSQNMTPYVWVQNGKITSVKW